MSPRKADSMTQPCVYVASPLGFSVPGRRYLLDVLHPRLVQLGVAVLDPWDDPDGAWAAAYELSPGPQRDLALDVLNSATGARNARFIASADAILAVLDGPDVDSGTAAEIGYAAALNKAVIGLRSDTRISADNERSFVNLQVEYFIVSSGGTCCRELDSALAALAKLLDR